MPQYSTTETAYCSTSALDPATQQPSPAATAYALFIAACTVTPSTGAVITSAQCPMNPSGIPPGSPAAGNPTGTCSITFQPQPGITYTVNSTHFLRFWPDAIPDPACPQGYPNITGLCWSDPLGYYAYPISYVPLVYSTPPVYSTKGTSVTPQDEPCGAIGDCASNQIIPLERPFPGGGGNLGVTQFWDLATSSAVSCPAPNVTSMLPQTWFAGKPSSVTMTGSGFNPTAVPGCPATTLWAASGAGVLTLSNLSITPTKITFTVTPPASAPTGGVKISMWNGTSGPSIPKAQILGNQIQWSGATTPNQVISTSDGSTPPTQDAVVGQTIALTTTTPTTTAYDGSPVSWTWTLTDGMNIGGYAATTPTTVTPTTLNQPSLTTYWLYPNSSVPVTYQYCVNIQGANPVLQCSLPANATFNVTGPTAQITPFQSANDTSYYTWGWWVSTPYTGCATNLGEPTQMLVFGMYPPPGADCTVSQPLFPGMVFQATNVNTAGVTAPNAQFWWVQLITGGQTTGTLIGGGAGTPGSLVIGLDNSFPYSVLNPTQDSPSSQLDNTWAYQSKTFSAQMYLMWNSNPGSTAIPVPIGYETWSINGSAYNGTGSPPWFLAPSSINSQATTSYTASNAQQPSYGMPVWSNVSLNGPSISESESNETNGEQENQQ